MNKYEQPMIEITNIPKEDIITTSPGTETGIQDETDGNWELWIGLK